MRDCCRPSRAVRERGRADRSSPPTAWEDGGNTVLQVRRSRWLRADTEMVCSSTPAVGRGELDRQPSHSAVDPAGHDQAGGRALSPGAAQEGPNRGHPQTGATRHSNLGGGRTGAILQPNSGRFQTGATRQLTSSELVPPVRRISARNWGHPSVDPSVDHGRTSSWCHPCV